MRAKPRKTAAWHRPALVAAIAAGLATPVIPARASRWISYTEADGLPGRVVVDLIQVPDGSVWAATTGGIARIDRRAPAARWHVITTQVFDVLAVDSEGVIWAGGDNGRIQWFDLDGTPLPTTIVLPPDDSGTVLALHAGPNRDMWLGHPGWLRRWRADLGDPHPEEWPVSGRVYDVERTVLGNLWLGLDDGVGFFDGTSITTYGLPDNPHGAERIVTAVLPLENEDVIVGSAAGRAYHFSRATITFSREIFQDARLPVIEDIHLDALGRVWIARKEAYRFDTNGQIGAPEEWTRFVFGAESGLNGDILQVILESSAYAGTALTPVGAREMWFGNDLGVAVQTGLPWTDYRRESGGLAGDSCRVDEATCNAVTAIAVDPGRDVVWFGARWGLSRLSRGDTWSVWTGGVLANPPVLASPSIRALHLDADGGLWVASGAAPGGPSGVQYHAPQAPDQDWVTLGTGEDRWRVSSIARDEEGFLWLAAQDGAWRLDTSASPFGETHFDVDDGLPDAPLTALAAGAGQVFVASMQGIGRYDLSTARWSVWPLSGLPGPLPSITSDLLVLGDRLYAATDVGMIVVPAAAQTLAEAVVLSATGPLDGTFASDIAALADGGDGSVLVAAPSGLYRVNAALDRAGRMGVLDGLPEEELLSVATAGDEVWIGMNGDGAAAHRFEAPETAIVESPPRVVVSIANPVVVVVAGADPDSPIEMLRFELRVDGGMWQPPQPGPNLSFIPMQLGLDEGPHVLQVRAMDNGLLVDRTPATAPFEIDTSPPMSRVSFPLEGSAVRGTLAILGTAEDLEDGRFESYFVGARPRDAGQAPWTVVQPWTSRAVHDSVLATWDTTRLPGGDDWYTLEVIALDLLGVQGVARVDVLVDNQPPFAEVTSPVRVRGSEGAMVHSTKGDAVLVIPPFAFDGDRTITVERESTDAVGGFGFRLGPPDLELGKLGTLQLRVPAGPNGSGGLPAGMRIHRQDAGGWTEVGGTAERRATGTFYSVAIDRMGLYALRVSSAPPRGGAVISRLRAEPRHFRPRTGGLDRVSVSFVLGRPAAVTAMVYNRAGRPRRVLAAGLRLGAGEQVLYWDGRDAAGALMASALYIICVEADGERVTRVVTVGRD